VFFKFRIHAAVNLIFGKSASASSHRILYFNKGKKTILSFSSSGVGKTSMVVRYIGKMFNHHISPTIGASFFTCKINIGDVKVKLQVR